MMINTILFGITGAVVGIILSIIDRGPLKWYIIVLAFAFLLCGFGYMIDIGVVGI